MRHVLVRAVLLQTAILLCAQEVLAFRTAGELEEFTDTERVKWAGEYVPFHLHEGTVTTISAEEGLETLQGAFVKWMSAECTGPLFEVVGFTPVPAAPGDGVNTVEWVLHDWSARGFAQDAAAATDVQYAREGAGEWRIVEADVYLNGSAFSWTMGDDTAPSARNLPAVMTHEVGHILGLLHPCEENDPTAPECADNPGYAETAMFPIYTSAQSMLSPDDMEAICFLYAQDSCSCASGDCTCDEATAAEDPALAAPAARPVGEACENYNDCASHACIEGTCSSLCRSQTDCRDEERCLESLGVCVEEGEDDGAECSTDFECAGGYCVSVNDRPGLCTHSCDARECPEGWTCASIDGENVCAPLSPNASGGACAVVADRTETMSLPYLMALGLGLAALRLRRSKRRIRLHATTSADPAQVTHEHRPHAEVPVGSDWQAKDSYGSRL